MKQAIVTLWGKYKYKIQLSGKETMHDIAMKIAMEVHKSEHKTKFTNVPRTYNYIYECLLRKSCLNFRLNTENTQNNKQELLNACNDLNQSSEWKKQTDDNGLVYYEHQDYRLGYTQSHTLIIDVDGKDEINLKRVVYYFQTVLQCKFKVIGTNKGYWLFSDKKYIRLIDFVYDHCRILNPQLDRFYFDDYREGLLLLDNPMGGEFKRATPGIIKSSKYYTVPSDIYFDVAFTFLSIKRERSTIRITKKHKNDTIHAIDI
jgi:hypothetical protein